MRNQFTQTMYSVSYIILINTLRSRRNEQHFADEIFKRIFFDENVWISITIPLKFVPKGPINNIPALVQIMAWRRSGDKPLSEPMMVSLTTHICVTRPQWVEIQLFCVPRCGQLCQFNCNALFVKVCRPIHIFCIQHFFSPECQVCTHGCCECQGYLQDKLYESQCVITGDYAPML